MRCTKETRGQKSLNHLNKFKALRQFVNLYQDHNNKQIPRDLAEFRNEPENNNQIEKTT